METPPTFMKFYNYPIVRTCKKDVRRTHAGNDVIVNSGRGGKNYEEQKEVSVQESIVGGDTSPIEFQTSEMIPIAEAIGLEDFFKMNNELKQMTAYSIWMAVVRIPAGKRFSICSNGARRTCAIVQLVSPVFTIYSRDALPDDWPNSTLILSPTNHTDFEMIEKSIKQLLEGLVKKSGHWDQNVLNWYREMIIDKLKHYRSDTIHEWVLRLFKKIMI